MQLKLHLFLAFSIITKKKAKLMNNKNTKTKIVVRTKRLPLFAYNMCTLSHYVFELITMTLQYSDIFCQKIPISNQKTNNLSSTYEIMQYLHTGHINIL